MKKALLFLAFLFPCITFAQSDNPISEDFYTNIKGIASVIHLDNDVNVMQISVDNKTFDLMAVNSNMKVLWRVTLQGYGVDMGVFKNKIAVVASTLKGNGNTYKGMIIDPATGNTLVEKVIYEDSDDYIEVPYVLIGNNYFKFSVRETNAPRKLHFGLSSLAVVQMFTWSKENNTTQKMQILDLNEQLETVNTTNAVVNGTLINIICNANADMFMSWLNSSDIEVYKYPAGKNAPSAQLTADIAIKPNDDTNLNELILFALSKTNPNDFYYSLLYRNEDKEPELMVGKMDFSNNTKNAVTHVFKKDELKTLEKSFIPVDKKINEHDLGPASGLAIKNMTKTDDGLIIILQGEHIKSVGATVEANALLMNDFTSDLHLKFQQIFPTDQGFSNSALTSGMHTVQNKLYMLGYSQKYISICAVLDLNTGQWLQMYSLIKKQNKGYPNERNTLWFANDYIIPYGTLHGYYSDKYNFGFQLNQY